MFRGLRTKLAVSYAVIILLCLALASLGAIVLTSRYQRESVLARHRLFAAVITQQVQTLVGLRIDLPRIASIVGREIERLGARALLVSSQGVVLADTAAEDPVTGQTLRIAPANLNWTDGWRYVDPTGRRFYLFSVPLRSSTGQTPATELLASHVVFAVPEKDFQPAWRELARPMIAAGLISAVLSLLAAAGLSRSITRPIIEMTRASTRIAAGEYDEPIAASGHDEVARLARSFNDMAREVERTRKAQQDLLANISHDLKTPLTSIQGFSQAMLEGAIHDEGGYQRAAYVINEEAERMGELILRLLEVARLDARKQSPRFEALSPADLVQRTVARFTPLAAEAQISLQSSVSADLPTLRGDAELLDQALSNLLDNALKYTLPGGQVSVVLKALQVLHGVPHGQVHPACTLSQLKDGSWLALYVKDTGQGISAEELPHVFERFYRAGKSRAGAGGLGLGLAIVKEAVQRHGGTVGVTSEPGQGSCFCILLPADGA